MTRQVKLLRILLRFLLVWAVDATVLWLTALLLPGFALVAREGYTSLTIAAVAALVLGLVNILICPTAVIGSLVLAAVNTVLTGPLILAGSNSFYEQRIRRLAHTGPLPDCCRNQHCRPAWDRPTDDRHALTMQTIGRTLGLMP